MSFIDAHHVRERGVYVTDPAHNIIFGAKCPALFGRFLRLVSSRFLCLVPFGSTDSVVFWFRYVFFDVFRIFFRKLLWCVSGGHFKLPFFPRSNIVVFLNFFIELKTTRISREVL